jgi:hypothetical protein
MSGGSVVIRSGKLKQRIDFSADEIKSCRFLSKSMTSAKDMCPDNHHVLPLVMRVTAQLPRAVDNLIFFMKNRPLIITCSTDITDLAVIACAFEMEELATLLLNWKPLDSTQQKIQEAKLQQVQEGRKFQNKLDCTFRSTEKYKTDTVHTEKALLTEGAVLVKRLQALQMCTPEKLNKFCC